MRINLKWKLIYQLNPSQCSRSFLYFLFAATQYSIKTVRSSIVLCQLIVRRDLDIAKQGAYNSTQEMFLS